MQEISTLIERIGFPMALVILLILGFWKAGKEISSWVKQAAAWAAPLVVRHVESGELVARATDANTTRLGNLSDALEQHADTAQSERADILALAKEAKEHAEAAATLSERIWAFLQKGSNNEPED